jgi:F0F1-type ATP synthase assembly protein I
MNQTDPKGTEERPSQVERPQNWGMLLDLGFRLGLSVVIGVGAGVLLDNWLGTRPIFILLGVAVGIGAAMYSIWDVARTEMKRR